MAKKKTPISAESKLLSDIHTGKGRRKRQLSDEEKDKMIRMLAFKADPDQFDIQTLVPAGSYLARMVRHFEDTDISYALPLMQLIMVAASWLTQNGAYLDIRGLGRIVPTLWMVGLAGSGEAKTLASDEIMTILSEDGKAPVEMLPTGSTDAQWIEDLAEHNGSFWFQDEVGKFFDKVLTQSGYQRIKPWMLDAYSYKTISNRLKSEIRKREIECPMFTFHGLSVRSTWQMDMDLVSMLDGFCQRMSFYLAPERRDTDMFEHFLYFTDPDTDRRRDDLNEFWHALCNQDGACGPYTLTSDVLPFLEEWWRGLRTSWGDTTLPKSFIRRIGFSIMRYLPVLHFLLGKARHPIDIETAQLATRYAEYHFQSTLNVLQDYDRAATERVQKVVALKAQLESEGKAPTARNIGRRLSAPQRADLPTDLVKEILAVLDKIEDVPGLIDGTMGHKEKSNALVGRLGEIRDKMALNERKRNERRLRELRKAYRQDGSAPPSVESDADDTVIEFERGGVRSLRAAKG